MTTQPMMLQGKLLKHVKVNEIVHGTLRLTNNSILHLVFKQTDSFIQLGQVLVMDAQPHVSAIVLPLSYHKPGVGNVTLFEVKEIKALDDTQAIINQFVYLTHLFNNHLSNLQSKNTLLTNNSYHDTIGA